MHGPVPALPGGGLGCGRRGEGVRVDLGEREMPEREPDTAGEHCFNAFDLPVRLPRVRAFIIPVLKDERAGGGPADVVELLIHWARGRLALS